MTNPSLYEMEITQSKNFISAVHLVELVASWVFYENLEKTKN